VKAYANLDAASGWSSVITYGNLVQAIINFVIVFFVL
jgi:large-conductance mechanosensitive channel